MSIITLISDLGTRDHYIGAVKGAIISNFPEVQIMDISHDIAPFDLNNAAFVLRNCYHNYPKGTVHIIGIKTEASNESPHIAVLFDGHYFVGADNGIFSLIFGDRKPEKIVELNVLQDSDYFTFSIRDVFAKVACDLARGKSIEKLGTIIDNVSQRILLTPIVEESLIKGSVIYIDSYENIITNISEKIFKSISKGRNFRITFGSYVITEISKSYDDVPVAETVALFGSTGMLEIALNQGKAGSLLGLEINSSVRIEFFD